MLHSAYDDKYLEPRRSLQLQRISAYNYAPALSLPSNGHSSPMIRVVDKQQAVVQAVQTISQGKPLNGYEFLLYSCSNTSIVLQIVCPPFQITCRNITARIQRKAKIIHRFTPDAPSTLPRSVLKTHQHKNNFKLYAKNFKKRQTRGGESGSPVRYTKRYVDLS